MRNSYQSILMQGAVSVRVPVESPEMRFKEEYLFDANGKTVYVPERWQNGMAIGRVILNRHFYGISGADLGKKIVAIVEVVEKATADGRKFTMLDVCKESNGTRPVQELKIVDILDTVGISIPIKGTNKFVSFKPL